MSRQPNPQQPPRDPNQPGGLQPSEPFRDPRPPQIPNHLGPLTERNKENLPFPQLRELERRQEEARIAAIARRTQLPIGSAVPAALHSELAALGRVGRGGTTRPALVEIETRPDGRRRIRAVDPHEAEGENRRWQPPAPLNAQDERTLAGGRQGVVPIPIAGGFRAGNIPNMDDLNPQDTGLPIDPPRPANLGFRR
jgi:hypothetical protein